MIKASETYINAVKAKPGEYFMAVPEHRQRIGKTIKTKRVRSLSYWRVRKLSKHVMTKSGKSLVAFARIYSVG